jgi:DNA polymerase
MADAEASQAQRLRRAMIQQLESLKRAGVTVIGRAPPAEASSPQPRDSAAVGAAAPTRLAKTAESARSPRDQITPAAGPPAVTPPARPAVSTSETTHTPRTAAHAMPENPTPRSARAPAETTPSLFDQGPQGPKLSLEERSEALRVLGDEVAACEQCAELVAHRTQTVFGVGNPQTRLCFFGEAPGADEDRQGEPFVGRAGQLLNKIIEACGMRREDVYIMNVLKCRPPNNRDPAPSEVGNCRGFFERQLDILRPEFICCLGKPAMASLLGTPPSVSLGRMRGQFHRYRGSKVIVTYHPAYLLRNPAAKKDTWEDMKLLLSEMGLEIPKRN